MESKNTEFPKGSSRRVKINLYRCVVCGALSAGSLGYLFYQTGRTRLGAPFCKEHTVDFHQYASPVFENLAAVDLFKQMFPQSYQEDVVGKHIIYFDTYRRKAAIEYCNKRRKKSIEQWKQ